MYFTHCMYPKCVGANSFLFIVDLLSCYCLKIKYINLNVLYQSFFIFSELNAIVFALKKVSIYNKYIFLELFKLLNKNL